MSRTLSITVLGTPAPQGSKKAFVRGGRPVVVEQQHDRVRSWRQAVLDEALDVMRAIDAPESSGGLGLAGLLPLAGPLELGMRFYLRRPAAHYGTGRNALILKPSAPAYPAKMPDLSKLARSTEDALTDAGIWGDDGQVVAYQPLAKFWAGHRLGHLAVPGAVITIRQLA